MEYIIDEFCFEKRVAGTDIDLILVFPELFLLADVTAVQFGLFDSSQYQLAMLTLENGVTITGQTLKVDVAPEVTEGKEGVLFFEYRITKAGAKIAAKGIIEIENSLLD